MSSFSEQYGQEIHRAVQDTAQAFHLRATTTDGRPLAVPCSYQIAEPGFRPFKFGKASPEELQDELDDAIAQAQVKKIDPGIEGREAVRKMSLQLGLGIDCSNFAYRSLALAHQRLGIGAYTDFVFRPAGEIRDLNASKPGWEAKDANGHPRELTDEEQAMLQTAEFISISSIVSLFGKDPEFIIGSKHMASPQAAECIAGTDALPGDIIAFKKAGTGSVSHLAVVENVENAGGDEVRVDFWHTWHTRDFESGLRQDSVTVDGSFSSWSHEGLADPSRYQGHYFCRPIGLAALAGSSA